MADPKRLAPNVPPVLWLVVDLETGNPIITWPPFDREAVARWAAMVAKTDGRPTAVVRYLRTRGGEVHRP